MTKHPLSSMRRDGWRWLALASFLLLASGCSSSRSVYIPPEWKTPPPAVSSQPQPPPRPQARSQPPAPADGQAYVLKPPPSIKESDMSGSPQPPAARPAEKKPAQPQRLASMHLVEQGKASLAQGKTEAAISLFEQAVQVDAYNGEAFMGLARAWRTKGLRQKALEFARKAEILFQDEPGKLKEVFLFEAAVYQEVGDPRKVDLYRKKASKL